jgi:cell wall-associated NlpC family hydrolase
MITGAMVAEAARQYVGAPIVEGGRSREGCDCVGLIVCTARDLGLSFPADVTNYGMNIWLHPRTKDARGLLSECMIEVDSPQVGDVILFSKSVIAITVGFIT